MKTLISTFLLTIVVFQNFGVLNAMEGEGSNLKRKRGRPSGPASRDENGHVMPGKFKVGDSRPVPYEGPLTGFVYFMDKHIQVWMDPQRTRVMKADFPGNTFPVGSPFYRRNDFLVRRTFVKYGDMVQYIRANGTLMGIRAPKMTSANVMEPTDTTWFIVFHARYFRLTVNPQTHAPERIDLIPHNQHTAADGFDEVKVAGIEFRVFSAGRLSGITGAELSPRRSPPLSLTLSLSPPFS